MINLIDLILIKDDVLNSNQCELIISEFETRKAESYKEASTEINSNKRIDTTVDVISLVPGSSTFQLAGDATNTMIGFYKNYIDKLGYFWTDGLISNLEYSHNYRLMKYDIGQSVHNHVDKTSFIYGSCSLILNDDYEGGVFSFFNGNHKLQLKKGQGVIFPADYFFVHQVEPVTKGCKYSINSFLGNISCITSRYPKGVINPHPTEYFHHKAAAESVVRKEGAAYEKNRIKKINRFKNTWRAR